MTRVVQLEPKAATLSAVQGRAREVINVVLNSIEAVEDYRCCCALESLAERFNTTAARLRIVLQGPIKFEFVTIQGRAKPIVFPTVKLLTAHDPHLTVDGASAIVRLAMGA